VVLETGLNDARGYRMRGLALFREHLAAALDAMSRAELVVLVLEQRIPRWDSYSPFDRGRPRVSAAYRHAQRLVAASRPNVVTVLADLEPADYLPDGVHPARSGHVALAGAVARAVRQQLAVGSGF
jgi:hypothetical protein